MFGGWVENTNHSWHLVWQETVGRFEIDGREGDHLPDRRAGEQRYVAVGRSRIPKCSLHFTLFHCTEAYLSFFFLRVSDFGTTVTPLSWRTGVTRVPGKKYWCRFASSGWIYSIIQSWLPGNIVQVDVWKGSLNDLPDLATTIPWFSLRSSDVACWKIFHLFMYIMDFPSFINLHLVRGLLVAMFDDTRGYIMVYPLYHIVLIPVSSQSHHYYPLVN